ncbi:MAG: CrcB family protein [Candidatus Nanopelagicales bacterium]
MERVPHDDLPVDPDQTAFAEPLTERAHADRRYPWDVMLVIAAGGAVGGGARWGLAQALPTSAPGFPWATFAENISGALALGVLMVYLLDVWRPSRYGRPFLAVGVLGGFTTFSTYTADVRTMLLDGHVSLALTYLVATLFFGLLATWCGLTLARRAVGVTRQVDL